MKQIESLDFKLSFFGDSMEEIARSYNEVWEEICTLQDRKNRIIYETETKINEINERIAKLEKIRQDLINK